MENHGILSWLSQRVKWGCAGALAGSLITLLFPLLVLICAGHGGSSLDWFLLFAWSGLLWPADQLYALFGQKLEIDTTVGRESSWILPTIVAALVNGTLVCVIGFAVGWVVNRGKSRENLL